MEKSYFLAKVIGLYCLIVGIVMLINMPQFIQYIDQLAHNPSLMFLCGFFTVILGILVIASHNVWRLHWSVLISLVGWLVLIKGLSLMLFPEYLDHFTIRMMGSQTFAYSAAALDFILGFVLCYCGFRRVG